MLCEAPETPTEWNVESVTHTWTNQDDRDAYSSKKQKVFGVPTLGEGGRGQAGWDKIPSLRGEKSKAPLRALSEPNINMSALQAFGMMKYAANNSCHDLHFCGYTIFAPHLMDPITANMNLCPLPLHDWINTKNISIFQNISKDLEGC